MTRAPAPVTIGVPVYNGEDYLPSSLTAIRDQQFGDFEVVIRDNASDDATEEICRQFAAADPRFRYERNDTNVGGGRNSNLLLDDARSPLFMWAYHDDICHPGLLQASVDALAEMPEAVAAVPRVQLIDEGGVVVGRHQDGDLDFTSAAAHERLRVVFRRMVGQIQFGLMRTDVVRAAGAVSVSTGGEMILPAALALRGPLVLLAEEPLLSIRQHEERHGGDRESEAAWIDPSRPHVPFPYARSTPLLLRAVAQSGLSARERRRSYATVLWDWTRPGWRSIAGDLVRLPYDAGWIRR